MYTYEQTLFKREKVPGKKLSGLILAEVGS